MMGRFASLVLACTAFARSTHAQAPDLVLVGGKVFTADSTRPWAEAVAIRGERITAVGTTAAIRALAGPQTRIIDVQGRVVIPGFNDAHEHIAGGTPGIEVALGGEMADLPASQVIDSLRVAAQRTPKGTWIRATLWTRAFEDTALRRGALDRAAPDHPVFLVTGWGHGAILNSAAMRMLGIRDDEPGFLGGWYERDTTGRLTGRLDEYAGWSARRKLRSFVPESTMVQNLRRYAQRELELGITSVQDMAIYFEPATAVRVYREADLPLRVHIYKFAIPARSSMNADQWDGVPSRLGPRALVRGRKWILDGSPLEGLMLTRGPQVGRPAGWHGRLNFPIDSVRAILATALRTREQVALHIVGDSTVALVLSLMESLAPDSVWWQHRVRFEHAGIVFNPDLWSRGAAKRVVMVGNLQLIPPAPVLRALPKIVLDTMALMFDPKVSATFPVGLGSDAVSRSPFVGLRNALSFPGTSISRETLVRWYTRGSAFAEFAERDKGTLAPGMLADIAVLSHDIFTVAVDALPQTESVLTLVGGRIVWDAGLMRR